MSIVKKLSANLPLVAAAGAFALAAAPALAQRIPPPTPSRPAPVGNTQGPNTIVRIHKHLQIGLFNLNYIKKSSPGGQLDQPYVVAIGFQGKIVPNPHKAKTFLLGSLVVSPVGACAHDDLGHPGAPWAKPGLRYPITGQTYSWNVDVNEPGVITGAVIFLLEQNETNYGIVRAMAQRIDQAVRASMSSYYDVPGNNGVINESVITTVALDIVREAWGYQIKDAINSLDSGGSFFHQIAPDTYGFMNLVVSATYPNQVVKAFAGPPIYNRTQLPMTDLVWKPTPRPFNFNITFPDGNPTNLLAAVQPKVRYGGLCQFSGAVRLD
ncbi:MAG: hypothetical protein HYR64_07145 [Fimbriimonas ginsengisoli]|uniref:Uncharacterized protein n=1 Tax=Fimbriimonas ginsengisoli TaxID=1005039 RepID=A0A931LY34_FIMGI|nr:hypothetical protein [Fimbriimonas ginsengisoli]